MTHLPNHPHLRHPRTGEPLRALGIFRGRPLWPVLGGSDDDDPPADPPPADPPADPKPDADKLGDPGKKALSEERAARKAAEAELAKYRKADADKADADKSESEKRAAAEQRAADAELKALRLEVGAEKGLKPSQIKRLVGATREELEADADELLADLGTPAAKEPEKKPGPKPDPSQGPKGDPKGRPTSLGAAVTQALSKR